MPFGHNRRGLWFDGKYSVLITEGLTLYHTGTLELWVNPESEGALYSSSKSKAESWHFGIDNDRLEFENGGVSVKSSIHTIVFAAW